MRPRPGDHTRTNGTVSLALALMLTGVASGVSGPPTAAGRPRAVTTLSGVPPEVRGEANAWPLPDHDYLNSRDAGMSPISSKTVSRRNV